MTWLSVPNLTKRALNLACALERSKFR